MHIGDDNVKTYRILVINPGSISLPRSGPATYCRLTLEDGAVLDAEILDTEGDPFVPASL